MRSATSFCVGDTPLGPADVLAACPGCSDDSKHVPPTQVLPEV